MVDKFRNILSAVMREKGVVTIFALLKMDELTEKWTVIFSAPWVSQTTIKENFEYLRQKIIRSLSPEELNTVSRLGIFPKTDHLIESMLVFKPGSVINEDTTVNGNVVHEGYILASDSNT